MLDSVLVQTFQPQANTISIPVGMTGTVGIANPFPGAKQIRVYFESNQAQAAYLSWGAAANVAVFPTDSDPVGVFGLPLLPNCAEVILNPIGPNGRGPTIGSLTAAPWRYFSVIGRVALAGRLYITPGEGA